VRGVLQERRVMMELQERQQRLRDAARKSGLEGDVRSHRELLAQVGLGTVGEHLAIQSNPAHSDPQSAICAMSDALAYH
jgi:hypothetical protein